MDQEKPTQEKRPNSPSAGAIEPSPQRAKPNAQDGTTDNTDQQQQQQPSTPTAVSSQAVVTPAVNPVLDVVVGTAVDGIVSAVIEKVYGPVEPSSPVQIFGNAVGTAIKPAISKMLTSFASSMKTAISGTDVVQNPKDGEEQNTSGNAGATSSASSFTQSQIDPIWRRSNSLLSINRTRQAVSQKDVEQLGKFSVVSYSLHVEEGVAIPDNRNHRLHEEMKDFDADILALQSVNESEFKALQIELADFGYQGVRQARFRTNLSDCIFYNTHRFTELERFGIYLHELIKKQAQDAGVDITEDLVAAMDTDSCVLALTLSCHITGQKLIIATTSLTEEHQNRQDLQTLELCSILKLRAAEGAQLAFILAAKFCFASHDAPYQILLDGRPNADSISLFDQQFPSDESGINPIVQEYKYGLKHNEDALKSSYMEVMGSEAESCWCDTLKVMEQGSYILHDSTMTTTTGVLAMPVGSVIGKGLPNDRMASSNVALKAWLSFKN